MSGEPPSRRVLFFGDWRDAGPRRRAARAEIPRRDIAETMLLQALAVRVDRFVDLGTGNGRVLAGQVF